MGHLQFLERLGLLPPANLWKGLAGPPPAHKEDQQNNGAKDRTAENQEKPAKKEKGPLPKDKGLAWGGVWLDDVRVLRAYWFASPKQKRIQKEEEEEEGLGVGPYKWPWRYGLWYEMEAEE